MERAPKQRIIFDEDMYDDEFLRNYLADDYEIYKDELDVSFDEYVEQRRDEGVLYDIKERDFTEKMASLRPSTHLLPVSAATTCSPTVRYKRSGMKTGICSSIVRTMTAAGPSSCVSSRMREPPHMKPYQRHGLHLGRETSEFLPSGVSFHVISDM